MGSVFSEQQCGKLEDVPYAAYQGNEFIERNKFVELFIRTHELDAHEAEVWSEDELDEVHDHLASGNPFQETALARLWRGVPDISKEIVWAVASQAFGEADARYQSGLRVAFGERVPQSFERCPTFGGRDGNSAATKDLEECVPFLELLSPNGVVAASRILWCCSQVEHVDYCPVLPVLVCLLLVFCSSEASAYSIVSAVLSRAEDDTTQRCTAREWEDRAPCPYLPLNSHQWGGVAKRTVALAAKLMPKEFANLRSLGVDVENAALRSLKDGLAWQLPFRALCRVYGVFFVSGTVVFMQHVVALWLNRRAELASCSSMDNAMAILVPTPGTSRVLEIPRAPLAEEPVVLDADGLLSPTTKAMCQVVEPCSGVALGVDDLARRASRLEVPGHLSHIKSGYLHPPKSERAIFCRPRLPKRPSRIVWDALWPYLWQWLPPVCRIRDPSLCFTPHLHGYSLLGLMQACDQMPLDTPMLLVLKVQGIERADIAGVIGAFLTTPLRRTGSRYVSLDQLSDLGVDPFGSYVFRVMGDTQSHGQPLVWNWSGHNEMLFSVDVAHHLNIGGGSPAISLDATLRDLSTSTCITFDSPPLLRVDHLEGSPVTSADLQMDCTVLDLEIWTLD